MRTAHLMPHTPPVTARPLERKPSRTADPYFTAAIADQSGQRRNNRGAPNRGREQRPEAQASGDAEPAGLTAKGAALRAMAPDFFALLDAAIWNGKEPEERLSSAAL